MNDDKKKSYIEVYGEFLDSFRLKEISPEEVGLLIAKFSQYFMQYNMLAQRSLKVYSGVKRNILTGTDSNGKELSVSKADALADATEEAAAYEEARAHVQNIEQCINALKSLQKGQLFEYSHQ